MVYHGVDIGESCHTDPSGRSGRKDLPIARVHQGYVATRRIAVDKYAVVAWLDLRAYGLGDDPARVLLERGRVALEPGSHFGRQGAGHARLNFGTTGDLLTEVVDRMATAIGT